MATTINHINSSTGETQTMVLTPAEMRLAKEAIQNKGAGISYAFMTASEKRVARNLIKKGYACKGRSGEGLMSFFFEANGTVIATLLG